MDYVRQGIFDVIHIVPPAATWSRSRHSGIPGQRPLRSRLALLGLPSLTPSENDKVNSANRALEVVLWCAEQALFCKSKAVGLNIIFPEDLGGQQSEGPSSLWVLREIQLLEGIHDARRAAGYLCQFTRTDFKRPLGVFLPLANCVQDFHSAGHVWNVFTTNSSTKDLYRRIVLAIIFIPL